MAEESSSPVGAGFQWELVSLYFDEDVNQDIVAPVRKAGFSVTIADEVGMLGVKNDELHLVKAVELGCVLVTNDKGFEAISIRWFEEEKHHNGIIIIRGKRPRSPGELVKALTELCQRIPPTKMADLVWSL